MRYELVKLERLTGRSASIVQQPSALQLVTPSSSSAAPRLARVLPSPAREEQPTASNAATAPARTAIIIGSSPVRPDARVAQDLRPTVGSSEGFGNAPRDTPVTRDA